MQGAATDAALNSLNFSAQTAVQGAIYEQLSPLGAGTGTGLGSSLGAIGTDAAAGVAGAAVNHAFTGRQRGLDGAVQPMAPSTALAATKGAILLAVDQFVQQVIARTILEAIQSTLGQLDAASLKGFASLSEAPDTTDAPTGQGPAEMARRAAAHIRQQMGLSIEMAIDQATRQATEAIGQRLLQGPGGRRQQRPRPGRRPGGHHSQRGDAAHRAGLAQRLRRGAGAPSAWPRARPWSRASPTSSRWAAAPLRQRCRCR